MFSRCWASASVWISKIDQPTAVIFSCQKREAPAFRSYLFELVVVGSNSRQHSAHKKRPVLDLRDPDKAEARLRYAFQNGIYRFS